MKNRLVKTVLSLSLAAALGMTSPAVLMAEEAATEAAAEEVKTFTIGLSGTDVLEITNQTTRVFDKTDYTPVTADAKEEASEEKADEKTEEAAPAYNLVITEDNGDTHTFENVEAEKWTDPVIYDQYGFLYIKYKDANGKEQEAAETADEKKFDTPLTMYVSTNVHVRKEASTEAESIKVSQLGDEWKVTAVVPGWFKVENEAGDVSGYAFHAYLTEDKAAVDALVQAKKEAEEAAARAAAEAAAQAAADQAAWEAQQQAQAQQKPQAVYEVSRQAYDDCDGSGHGYFEITMSDGSVRYEEY